MFAYCLNNPVNRGDYCGCASSSSEDADGNGIPDGCCICLKGVGAFYVSIRQDAQAGTWSVGIEAASQS
jgi:hypothetical protein